MVFCDCKGTGVHDPGGPSLPVSCRGGAKQLCPRLDGQRAQGALGCSGIARVRITLTLGGGQKTPNRFID